MGYTITIKAPSGFFYGDTFIEKEYSYEVESVENASQCVLMEAETLGFDLYMDGGKAWFEFIASVENGIADEYDHGDGIVIAFG